MTQQAIGNHIYVWLPSLLGRIFRAGLAAPNGLPSMEVVLFHKRVKTSDQESSEKIPKMLANQRGGTYPETQWWG